MHAVIGRLRRTVAIGVPFFGIMLGFVVAATAAPQPGAGLLLGSFDLIATGNVTTNQDIEGPAVIGGNLSGGTFFNNNAPANPAIYLFGSQSGNLNINSGGNLYMNGTPGGPVNYNGGGHLISSGPPQPLSYYTAPLAQLSSDLAGLMQTAGNTISAGAFHAFAGTDGLSVFNITGTALQTALNNANIGFNIAPGVSEVVVNVTGNFTEPSSANWNTLAQNVLFNFTDAASVNLGNWQSSILAPSADLHVMNGAINGSVFTHNFTGGGEIHYRPYTMTIATTTSSLPAVPEPATLSLLGLGAAATLLARRRRKA